MNNDMTQGKILPVLIRFTIPILLGDLFQQLYNVVDTIIVGRTLGSGALAAVGATGTVMFLVLGFASALANGFAVVTSQRFGAKDAAGIKKSFASSILLMLILGSLTSLLARLGMHALLTAMNTPEDIFQDAYTYITVICSGILATVFYNLFAASLRSIGNSRVPLYFLIFSSFLNVFLDLFFIVGLKMGVEGAAGATILSQGISAFLSAIYIIKKEPSLVPDRKDYWIPDVEIVKLQLTIGVPMALQYAITASGTIIMQAATNIFGSVAVAANTAASKCRMLCTQPMASTGISLATYCGQNYGKRDMDRIKKGVWTVVRILVVYSLVVGILLVWALPLELRLFFNQSQDVEELLPWARIYIYEAVICFIPLSWIFIFRNSMQGFGRSLLPMSAGFVELFSRMIVAAIAMHTMNYYISCMCDPAAWITGGVYTMIAFIWSSKDTEKKLLAQKTQP